MMVKKQEPKKTKKAEVILTPEESQELQMILDRLSVQNPEGMSLDNCLQSLRRALAGRENLIVALVERLSKNPTPVGFRVFLVLEGLIGNKDYRRIVKQAGYRFAQRGFAEEPQAASAQKVVLIQKESRNPIAYLVPTDDAAWFVAALFPGEEYSVPIAVSSFAEHHFQQINVRVLESSHKLYREFIEKLANHLPNRPYSVPIEHGARIFFELFEFYRGEGVPAEGERGKQFFLPYYDPERPPHVYSLMPAVEEPGRHLSEVDIKGLFETLSFAALSFSKEDLLPYMEQIHALESSVLVVPPEVQQERAVKLIEKAADELCTGSTRLLLQRYCEEQTLWLKLAAKTDLARSAWIVAQHLRSTARAGENPVVTQLIALTMQLYWPEELKPEARETSAFKETETGIIIPR